MVKKNFEDMYNRLDSIPACDRQMDRQTDILPRHSPRYAYLSRGKNRDFRPIYLFIWEVIQHRAIVTVEGELKTVPPFDWYHQNHGSRYNFK